MWLKNNVLLFQLQNLYFKSIKKNFFIFFRQENTGLTKSNNDDEPIWKNIKKYAMPKQEMTYTDYKEIEIDWDYVERLMPLEIIPEPPSSSEPLPSGWRSPQNSMLNLPYYIRRKPNHLPPLYLERRRDELNPKTMDFEYVELVILRNIEGDIFACKKDLQQYLEEKLNQFVAIHVDELKGLIKIKGADRTLLEKFFYEKGF